MTFLIALFGILSVLIIYPYLLYPLAIFCLAKCRPKNSFMEAADLVNLTMIIPAYNEEDVIEAKIENTLELDYPPEKIEIIVVSDASSDGTNEIVKKYVSRGVRLIENKERKGKTFGLNRAYEEAQGDVLIFTDADAYFESNTLRMLTRHFSNPQIGLVTGSTKYRGRDEDDQQVENMGLYTRFERWLKNQESQIHSCVGADGAVFAMRRDLYRPLDEKDINDFVLPLDVVRQGYRAVIDLEAFCIEESIIGQHGEFHRQVRIANRTVRALYVHRDLLNPFRYGLFSWMLWSHRVARLKLPWFVLLEMIVALTLLLVTEGLFFKYVTVIMVCLLMLIIMLKESQGKLASFLGMFVSLNLAYALGGLKALNRQTIVTWENKQDS